MPLNDVTLRLHDGRAVTIGSDEVMALFDELWLLAPTTRGAVTAAAKVRVPSIYGRHPADDTLSAHESAAILAALQRLHPQS